MYRERSSFRYSGPKPYRALRSKLKTSTLTWTWSWKVNREPVQLPQNGSHVLVLWLSLVCMLQRSALVEVSMPFPDAPQSTLQWLSLDVTRAQGRDILGTPTQAGEKLPLSQLPAVYPAAMTYPGGLPDCRPDLSRGKSFQRPFHFRSHNHLATPNLVPPTLQQHLHLIKVEP